MSYHAHQHLPNNSWSSNDDDFEYPEPNYPYLYASSVGHVTPAVSSAPLPPPSNAPSHHSSAFVSTRGGKGKRMAPARAYSDTSRTSGDSYITPSVSISQVGNRQRHASHASKSRSRAKSFASRENLRPVPTRQQTNYTATSRPSTVVTHSPRPHEAFPAEPSRSGQVVRRLRSVLKKPRPPIDSESYTSSSSTPMVVPQPRIMSSPASSRPAELERSESPSDDRQSMALSSSVQRTRFHAQGVQVSEHLRKPWDARSPPRFNSSIRDAPAFDNPNVRSINLIVPGLPWSVHVRARTSGKSRSRSRSRHDQITVGDVVDSVYASLNKSLTRTDVRAASSKTKKMIANAAAAAEVESERGEHSARRGKPSAARRIDFLGPRIWFKGLTKDDSFAREEGYGITEGELESVWVMIFAETKHQHQVRSATL